jgi:adenosylcobinamide-phosphate synthase
VDRKSAHDRDHRTAGRTGPLPGGGLPEVVALQLPAVPAALRLGLLLGLLLKPMLAWRVRVDGVMAVETALAQSLVAGRSPAACRVSRDAAPLDAVQVREAALWPLADKLDDSLVAAFLWFVLFGLPRAALSRFATTADAKWGYRDQWAWAGKWATRADEGLSGLPARLTAALLLAVAGRKPPWTAFKADARCTPSPDAGWPLGAKAQLRGVVLSKQETYALPAGVSTAGPADTKRALAWAGRWVWAAGAMACGGIALVGGWL